MSFIENYENKDYKYLFLEDKVMKVIKYFLNKNIFRYSPRLKTEIILKIRNQILMNKKIKFVMYWGVGEKNNIDEFDISAIKFQKKWLDEFSKIIGLEYEVDYIISDTHAYINSIPNYLTQNYIKSVENILCDYGYNVIMSSTLLHKYNIDIIQAINSYDINNILENNSYSSMIKGLKQQAESHSYINDDKSYISYFKANLIENSLISEEYSKHIFITYKPPQEKMFLPSLPKIYTFVDINQETKRPWFHNKDK